MSRGFPVVLYNHKGTKHTKGKREPSLLGTNFFGSRLPDPRAPIPNSRKIAGITKSRQDREKYQALQNFTKAISECR